MNNIETASVDHIEDNGKTPALTRKIGGKTFEVYVHFSETSKETLTDKIMRLVHNDIHSTNLN